MIGLVWSRVMDRRRKIYGGGEVRRHAVAGDPVAEQRVVGMDDILVTPSSLAVFFRLFLSH